MLNMFRNMWLEYKINFYEYANHVIYFFQHIPLIGKKIKDKLYSLDDYKMAFGILGFIISLINRFFKILAPLIVYLSGILAYKLILNNKLTFDYGKKIFLVYFWIFSVVMGSFINHRVYDFSKKEYLLFKVLNSNVKIHYLTQILTKILSQSVIYFIIFFMLFKTKKAFILVLVIASYRLIGETFTIIKNKYVKIKNDKLDSILIIGLLISVIIMALFTLKYPMELFINIIFNPIHLIGSLIVGLISALYIITYKDYYKYVKKNLTRKFIIGFNDILNSSKEQPIEINEKKLKNEELDSKRFEKKSGYEYLNEIFFVRNSKIINKPLKIKCLCISLIFIVLNISILFLNSKLKSGIWNTFNELITFMVFLMYVLSSGRNVIKALFYYCDRSLLKYGYYRKGNAVLKNFYLRIKKVVLIDFIPALLICVGLIVSTISLGHINDIIRIIPLLLCTLILPVFYSVYYMAIYYLFQPYTSEMENVSPVFKFASGFIYFLAYLSINYKGDKLIFTIVVLIVTIITTLVSLVLIYLRAPKTFKIK